MNARTYTGTACAHGHTERYLPSRNCVECARVNASRRREEAPSTVARIRRAQYARSRTDKIARADTLWYSCKRRAAQQGVPFTLTREWVREKLLAGKCEATGMTFVCRTGPRTARSPSVDRLRPNDGYTPENCRMIVWALNAALGTWGEEILRDVMAAWNFTKDRR